MLIKKDESEEMEKVLSSKDVNEQAKNLLLGIVYKIETSYKDYKKAKCVKRTKQEYISEIVENIDKKCDKISVVKLRTKILDENIDKILKKNKYYVGEEIVSYPIEEKILYAIESKSRNSKIVSNKYEENSIPISDLINIGKNLNEIEPLKDFNGWSWSTIKSEIEDINANLVYQLIQQLLGEKFLTDWCNDKDGIIDYMDVFYENMSKTYGKRNASEFLDLFKKISLNNYGLKCNDFLDEMNKKIQEIDLKLANFVDSKTIIEKLSIENKKCLQKLDVIEKVLSNEENLKAEYKKINDKLPIDKKIFNLKIFRAKIENKKEEVLDKIEENQRKLNPQNFLKEKEKLIEQKENITINEENLATYKIELIKTFIKCFNMLISKIENEEEIFRLIFKLRYFELLPFDINQNICQVEELEEELEKLENNLTKKAISKKIIANIPFEIMHKIYRTRIISLEKIFCKIKKQDDKYFAEIFDENVTEEKFELIIKDKIKINKKIRIFI